MNNIKDIVNKATNRRKLKRCIALLSAVVVLVTTNRLMLPVDAMERGVAGGAIYEDDLIIEEMGDEASADFEAEDDEPYLSDEVTLADDLLLLDQAEDEELALDQDDAALADIPEDAQATSADLRDFVDDAQLIVADESVAWNIALGETYALRLHFSEQSELGFDQEELFYALPEGLVSTTDAGATGKVWGEYSVENGRSLTVRCAFEDGDRDFFLDIPVAFEREGGFDFGNGVRREAALVRAEAEDQPAEPKQDAQAAEAVPEAEEQPAEEVEEAIPEAEEQLIEEAEAAPEEAEAAPEEEEQPAEEVEEIIPEEAEQLIEEVEAAPEEEIAPEEEQPAEAEEEVYSEEEQPIEEAEAAPEAGEQPEEAEEPAEEAAQEAEIASVEPEQPEEVEQPEEAEQTEEIERPEEAEQPEEPEEAEESEGGNAAESETEATYTFGEEKTVLLSEILDALELTAELSDCEAALSEGAPVRLERQGDDYRLTAEDFFESAALTLTSGEDEIIIYISNPETGIRMVAGDAMTSENGTATVVFEEDIVLPEGTELTAETSKPDLDAATRAEVEAQLKETLGDTPFEVIWYDVALGDIHDVQATLTLEEAAEADDQVIVVHVREDNEVRVIEDVAVADSGAVTFATDGFSPIGVVRLLAATSEGNPALVLNVSLSTKLENTQHTVEFTPEYTHKYTITLTDAYTVTSGTDANREYILRDENGTVQTSGTAYKSRTYTFDNVELEGGKTYYLDYRRVTATSTKNVTIKATRGNHDYGDDHVCECGEIEPWYIDDNGVLHVQTDAGAASKGWASQKANITGIVVEEGVTTLPASFLDSGYTNLTSMEIPASVTTIPSGAFSNAPKLQTVEFDADSPITELPDSLFKGCAQLENVTLPEGLTSIGQSAFENCAALSDLDVPHTVTEIGASAFKGCAELESISLRKVTTIGANAFEGCDALTEVELPGTLKNIGKSVFAGCDSLETVTFARDNTMTKLPEGLFADCAALTNVTLPLDLEDLPDNTFKGCASLETVDIPKGVQTIGACAFEGCTSLEKVELHEGITEIKAKAFSDCKALEAVKFPSTLKTLGDEAYKGCESLSEIKLPASVTTVGKDVFKSCTGIISAYLSESTLEAVPEGLLRDCTSLEEVELADDLKGIGVSAFNGCTALETIELPAGLQYIDNNAFSQCGALSSLREGDAAGTIRLPEGLTRIGKSAFQGCHAFVDIEVPDSVTELGASALTNCKNLERAVIGAGINEINESLFLGDEKLRDITFKGDIKVIPKNTFKGCKNLTKFTFPQTLEEIGESAFQDCTGLTSLNFPGTLVKVGNSAFQGCSQLTSAVFADKPADSTDDRKLTIGNNAFYSLSKLSQVTFPSHLGEVGNYAFYNCTAIDTLNLPEGLTKIGEYAFYNLNKVTTLKLPETLQRIGNNAFQKCTGLVDVTFPTGNSLTYVGDYAFHGCSKLTSAMLPDSVTYLGPRAFMNCSALKKAHFPSSLLELKDYVFSGCKVLEEVNDLPASLTKIGQYAFRNCYKLPDVTLPETLNSIGQRAFYDCNSLTRIDIPDSVTTLNTYAFYSCDNLLEAKLPAGLMTIPDYCFQNCVNLRKVTYPTALTTINQYAFSGCKQLEEAILPDTVKTIGTYAYQNCTALKTVRIPQAATSIGSAAFSGCSGLENLILDNEKTITVNAFSTGTKYTLTIGEHMKALTSAVLSTLVSSGANMLAFEKNDSFTLPGLTKSGFPRPLSDLGGGTYCSDEFGALYRIDTDSETKEKTATLVYVPDGLESYTIPATVGNGVPVVGVKSNALYLAQALTSLTIDADPESLTLDSYAFAYAQNLEEVNGETTKAGARALFDETKIGQQLFYNTKLTEAPQGKDVGDLVYYGEYTEGEQTLKHNEDFENGWSGLAKVSLSLTAKSERGDVTGETLKDSTQTGLVRDPVTGAYLNFTGEPVTVYIDISNAESSLIDDADRIRIYFQADQGAQVTPESGDKSQVKDSKGNIIYYTFKETTDVPGVCYIEISRPWNGGTQSFSAPILFPNITSGGGNVTVWAEYVKSKDVDNTVGKASTPPEKFLVINSIPRPRDCTVTKNPKDSSTTLTVDVAKDGTAFIKSHSYTIDVDIDEEEIQVGRDFMKKVEFVDTLQTPPGVVLNPQIFEEIKNDKILYSSSDNYKYIDSPSCGRLFTFYSDKNADVYQIPHLVQLGDSEHPQLGIKWTVVNSNPNYNGNAKEIVIPSVTMTVGDKVMIVEKKEEDKEYTLTNRVDITQHYCYSEPKTHFDTAEYKVNSGSVDFEVLKKGANGVRGEYSPYTLEIHSNGIRPVTQDELMTISDDIDNGYNSHYIAAADIYKLFTGAPYEMPGLEDVTVPAMQNVLTLTIHGAHLYGKESGQLAATKREVTTVNGGTAYTDQENTGYNTPYSTGTGPDEYEKDKNATFVFTMKDGKVHYTLTGSDGSTIANGNVDSGKAIQEMFDEQGFFVTSGTTYSVNWDTKDIEDFSIPAGATLKITLPTTYKDVFMRIDSDRWKSESYSSNVNNEVKNIAWANRSDDEKKKKSEQTSYTHSLDWRIGKSAEAVDTRNYTRIDDVTNEPFCDVDVIDAIEYTVNVEHMGTAKYDVMPVTDHMSLKQRLLVPAEQNPQLADKGLETYRCKKDGRNYYILGEGKYSDVYTNETQIAEHISVTEDGNGGYDTIIHWYLGNCGGARTYAFKYKAKIEQNDFEVGETAYDYANRTWVGDHYSHRLYDSIVSHGDLYTGPNLVRSFDKKIVDFVGDTAPGYDYCGVAKGQEVVYRLSFKNPDVKDFVITGDRLQDYLPNAYDYNTNALSTWKKSNVKVEYVGFEVEHGDDWSIERLSNRYYGYQIKWPDEFSMKCTNPDGIGYIYITLTFPSGTDWDNYVSIHGKTRLRNIMRLNRNGAIWEEDEVQHDLYDAGKVRLQKGVYRTGGYKKNANGNWENYSRTGVDSLSNYENDDSVRRKVFYYITLYNGGKTNLYLNDIQDVLPKGFTYCSAKYESSGYASVSGASYLNTTYSQLKVDATGTTADGRQLVKLTLKPRTDSNVEQYNKEIGKYYLTPGQAAVIRLECLTNKYEETENIATNRVTMPYYDLLDQHVTVATNASTASGTGANLTANDGGCEIDYNNHIGSLGFDVEGQDRTTEWLLSEVSLSRGGIRPSLIKKLAKSTRYLNGEPIVSENPVYTNPADLLEWSLDVGNDGHSAMLDYVVTDVMPNPYNFTGEVSFAQAFNSSEKPTPVELFSIERQTEKDAENNIRVLPGMTFHTKDGDVSYTIGDPAVQLTTYGTWGKIWVRIDLVDGEDEQKDERMCIRFEPDTMAVPSGGNVTVLLHSQNLKDRKDDKVFTNFAYVTPLKETQHNWEGTPRMGSSVKDFDTPWNDAGEEYPSVRSSALLTSSFSGKSSSVKAIQEKENKVNKADSIDKSKNYITVRDKDRVLTYTLTVTSENDQPMKRVVLIDNLPYKGDHTVFQADDPRNSAFRVKLFSEPDFKVWAVSEKGTEKTLYPGEGSPCKIQWSELRVFGAEDWEGENSSKWHDWPTTEDGIKDAVDKAYAVRLVFDEDYRNSNDYSIQNKSDLCFSFDALIDAEDEGATPGAIAWNSFGYHYNLVGRNATLEAAPLVVGVRVPDLPDLVKKMVNSRGEPYVAKEDTTFHYVMYEGEQITYISSSRMDANIIGRINSNKRKYVLFDITIPAGSSTGSFSFDEYTGYYLPSGATNKSGTFVDEPWVMNDNTNYNIVELSTTSEYTRKAYTWNRSTSLTANTMPYCQFTYKYSDSSSGIEIVNQNQHNDWSLKLQKVDQKGRPVGGAVFGVYTPLSLEVPEYLRDVEEASLTEDQKAELLAKLNEAFGTTLDTLPALTQEKSGVKYTLMALVTTNGGGEVQLNSLSGSSYFYKELVVPEHYEKVDDAKGVVNRLSSSSTAIVTKTVVNNYVVNEEDSQIYIDGHKTLTGGRPLGEGEFSFRLVDFDILTMARKEDSERRLTVPNDANGDFRFGPIQMGVNDIGKVYYYLITEVTPEDIETEVVPRIDYDQNQYIVKATVEDEGEGKLDVKQEYFQLEKGELKAFEDGSFAFTNRYIDETSASIPVKKVLADWKDGDTYTFELYGAENPAAGEDQLIDARTWEVTTHKDDPQATFHLDYNQDQLGEWVYKLREQIPANAKGYDRSTNAVVKVYKKTTGQGMMDLTYGDYENKLKEGRNNLAEKDIYWKLDGIVYDKTEHTVRVEVYYDEGKERLATRVYLDGSDASMTESDAVQFTNEFVAEPTSATAIVSKEIENRPWLRPEDESYKISVTPRDGAPAPSVSEIKISRSYTPEEKVKPVQSSSFVIPFEWKDLEKEDGGHLDSKAFYYDLAEVIPDGAENVEVEGVERKMVDRVLYDETTRTVKVTLFNNGDGTMRTEVEYLDAEGKPVLDDAGNPQPIAFVNTYVKEPELLQFPVTVAKRVNNVNATAGEYSFTLYDAEGKPVATDITWKAEDVGEELKRANAVIRVVDCKIDTSDVDVDKPKTVKYYLREDIPGKAVGYDASGESIGLYEAALDTEKVDESIKWVLDGMTYQSARIPVEVEVSLSEVDYRMHAEVSYKVNNRVEDVATFNNAYASQGSTGMSVKKVLTGREAKEGESFTFELLPLEGAPLYVLKDGEKVKQDKLTLAVGAGEKKAFEALQFDLNVMPKRGDGMGGEWEFSYLVQEPVPGDATTEIDGKAVRYADATLDQKLANTWKVEGVVFDKARIVKVHVQDDGKGQLSVTYVEDSEQEMTFTNRYEPEPVSVEIPVKKIILDRQGKEVDWKDEALNLNWQDMEFQFKLTPEDSGFPGLDAEKETVTVTYGSQTATFEPIEFREKGEYTYTIREVLAGYGVTEKLPYSKEKSLLYDESSHRVTVTVEDDLKGNLSYTVVYDGSAENEAPVVFKNREMLEKGTINLEKQWMENGVLQSGGPTLAVPPSITVHVYRKASDDQQAQEIDANTKLPAENGKEPAPFVLSPVDGEWKWQIDDLLNYQETEDGIVVYSYFVVEDSPEPWKVASYADPDRRETRERGQSADIKVKDGGTIVITNSINAVSLPATGGPGTGIFTGLGALMTILAAVLLVAKRRED